VHHRSPHIAPDVSVLDQPAHARISVRPAERILKTRQELLRLVPGQIRYALPKSGAPTTATEALGHLNEGRGPCRHQDPRSAAELSQRAGILSVDFRPVEGVVRTSAVCSWCRDPLRSEEPVMLVGKTGHGVRTSLTVVPNAARVGKLYHPTCLALQALATRPTVGQP
jgi:hypothetical protein